MKPLIADFVQFSCVSANLFWKQDSVLDYVCSKLSHFLKIVFFSKILSLNQFGNL